MTFALEFDTDEETQRVMRVALMRYVVHCGDEIDRGDAQRHEQAVRVCSSILSVDQPWDRIDEGGIAILNLALRHEIENGSPNNAAKAQEIIDKVDERFHELFRRLPPGVII
jgi:hypothetical protein